MKKHLSFTLMALVGAFVAMAFVSDVPEADPVSPGMADGEEVYMTRCLSCHQANGEGVQGVFPPLSESEHVSGDKGVLIRMLLHGLSGQIEVKGTVYSGMMPPWGGFLNDEQIADVLTYIRTNFGNEGDAVSAEEVARVRAATADRKEVWTMEDLTKEENRGIPDGE